MILWFSCTLFFLSVGFVALNTIWCVVDNVFMAYIALLCGVIWVDLLLRRHHRCRMSTLNVYE